MSDAKKFAEIFDGLKQAFWYIQSQQATGKRQKHRESHGSS